VAIGIATHGAFFADALGGDLGRKLASGEESHGGFPGFHLLLMPFLAFPASLWVLRAGPSAFAARRSDATGFLLAWLIPCWLVFEAVPTKLPHYTLPLYPALFLLAAKYGMGPVALWLRRASSAVVGITAMLLANAAVVLPILLHAAWWLGLPALPGLGLTVWLAWRGRPAWALLAAVPIYAALLQIELPRLRPLWIAPRVEAILKQSSFTLASGARLVAGGYAEPSLLFLAGPHMLLMPNGKSAADALARDRVAAIVNDSDLAAFLAESAEQGMSPTALGTVSGYNYSRGRPVTLTIYAK
jgi:4-amino-4-deoxy-L-arabinose transferase-like glycosyltransferase